MSDDSFIREVDEELRQDRVKALWTRFGAYLLGGVVLVLAVTIGYVSYERYTTSQANAAGDRYAAALTLAEEGQNEEAIAALEAIVAEGVGAYPALARMSIGGIEAEMGDAAAAVSAFDAVASDSGAPQTMRDMAAIRAAYVLVDSGSLEEVRSRVERLSGDSEPLRFPAREAIALAAWKAGDAQTARPLLESLVNDGGTPSAMSSRARILLDLIDGGADSPDVAASGEGAAAQGQAVAPTGVAEGSDEVSPAISTDAPAQAEGGAIGVPQMPTTNLGISGDAPTDPDGVAAPAMDGGAASTGDEAAEDPTANPGSGEAADASTSPDDAAPDASDPQPGPAEPAN
ncbi:tetratricopeptide repeat protein [Jiella marina]|uniref:tetratricopeptide repeat protein n=1 Tax=Jiella sp. LLJ827 TaxID=2917712 RepID=UPI002101729A|nr:tetratricopeptide repeat protein [Jiella sp. LLJ827]MCQ0986596.1 tetratricopeptide repeat protein [Jiella sp. LLJ827]